MNENIENLCQSCKKVPPADNDIFCEKCRNVIDSLKSKTGSNHISTLNKTTKIDKKQECST